MTLLGHRSTTKRPDTNFNNTVSSTTFWRIRLLRVAHPDVDFGVVAQTACQQVAFDDFCSFMSYLEGTHFTLQRVLASNDLHRLNVVGSIERGE